MQMNLLHDCKVLAVENTAAAGQTEVVSDVVDMQGYDSIAFIAKTGDVTDTCVLTLTGKTNTANSVSSPTPTTLTDTATFTAGATDADDKLLILDLHKPRDRYVFLSLTRTTADAVIECVIAILYNSHERKLAPDSGIIASAHVNDPA